MSLFSRLFPKATQLAEAEKRAETAAADLSETKRQLATLWESYHAHDATIKAQRETIDGLKAKLREQNDADLMLVSAKLIATILKGEKPAKADTARYYDLMAARQQMGGPSPYANLYAGQAGGMLNMLGLGHIFQ